MPKQQEIYVYEIPTIPDCTHHSLVTLFGGKVREHIFRASEHLLRMIANFQEGQIALALRFIFDPCTASGLQQRLQLQLAVKIGEGVSKATVKQLVDSGPLYEFYQPSEIKPGDPRKTYDLPDRYPFICELIRQEERVKPLVTEEQNPERIPPLLLFPALL